jgi:hypothetical protein
MTAPRTVTPNRPAPPTSRRSTRGFSSRQSAGPIHSNRCGRRPACASRPSGDLAGRSVALSIDVPVVFDTPLAPHHKIVGRWAATREAAAHRYTRHETRARIEQAFEAAVLDILKPFTLVDLRVAVLIGDDQLPPAVAVICDSIGQIDLGWIEADNVLSQTLFKHVAPLGWRAAAYKALCETLVTVLPVFGYEDLFEEVSAHYWDGATDDASARQCQIDWQGTDPDEIDEDPTGCCRRMRRP